MSTLRYASIFFAFFFVLAIPSHAELNLDLLENSPTPTPRPAGQEYILEVRHPQAGEEEVPSTLSPGDQNIFDEQGYVVRSGTASSELILEKTQLSYQQFKGISSEEQSTQVQANTSGMQGYRIFLSTASPLRSSDKAVIPDTRCNLEKPCTKLRSSEWVENTGTGVGYSISGKHARSDFSPTEYRPIPKDPFPILESSSSSATDRAKFTVRIDTDHISDGIYSGVLNLILLPY